MFEKQEKMIKKLTVLLFIFIGSSTAFAQQHRVDKASWDETIQSLKEESTVPAKKSRDITQKVRAVRVVRRKISNGRKRVIATPFFWTRTTMLRLS